jgi:hypothetical protein
MPLKRQYYYLRGDKVIYLILEDGGGLIIIKGGIDLIEEYHGSYHVTCSLPN